MVRDIYIAETDEKAWAKPVRRSPVLAFATDNVWRGDSLSPDSLPKFTERYPYFPGGLTVKRLDEWGTSLIGSPQTVIKKARDMIAIARPDSSGRHVQFWRSQPSASHALDRNLRDQGDSGAGSLKEVKRQK